VVSFPGRSEGTLGAHIYDIHHQPALHKLNKLTPDALQVLHVAAHIDTIQSIIRPHVEKGGLVLLDRYWWSTWVYGKLSGVQASALEQMIALELAYWDLIFPALIFSISRPIEEIDPREKKCYRERAQEYERLADNEGMHSKVVRINNSASVAKSALAIIYAIEAHRTRDKKASLADPDGTAKKQNNQERSDRTAPHLPFEVSSNGCTSRSDSPGKTYPTLWARLAPAKPTVVFDTYWRFATERQEIFFHRFSGHSEPWTSDSILLHYKFTNAYRASDRVSQFLIRQVIYSGSQTHRDLFFRTILFKLFNRIETWEKLESSLGELSAKTFDLAK
jgi:thymidylate kinase